MSSSYPWPRVLLDRTGPFKYLLRTVRRSYAELVRVWPAATSNRRGFCSFKCLPGVYFLLFKGITWSSLLFVNMAVIQFNFMRHFVFIVFLFVIDVILLFPVFCLSFISTENKLACYTSYLLKFTYYKLAFIFIHNMWFLF